MNSIYNVNSSFPSFCLIILLLSHSITRSKSVMSSRMKNCQITPVVLTVRNLQHVNDIGLQPRSIETSLENQGTDAVLKEKQEKKWKAEKRHTSYKNVLYNIPNTSDNGISCYVGMYGLAGTVFGVILNSPLALIPLNNVLTNPEYFYEEMLWNFCSLPLWTAQFLITCIYCMNVDCIKTMKHFGIASTLLLLPLICQRLLVYLVWTEGTKYPYPMPFHTTLSRFICILSGFIVVWRLFDSEWRKNGHFRTRYFFFIVLYLLMFVIHAQYSFWGKLFMKISPRYQWILAVTLPALREFNIWIFCKLAYKAAGGMDPSVEIAASFNFNTRHGIFLSVMLGTAATDLSCWIIFGTDFMINLYMVLKLIWIKKWGKLDDEESNVRKMADLLIAITLNEFVELMVTITFFISFLMLYYGPNAELIGNIKSEYFQNIPVSDIDRFVENVALFLGVEVITVLVSLSLLWVTCRINMVRAYLVLQKEFWLMMTIYMSYTVFLYFNASLISNAVDMTFEFEWLDNGNCTMNATKNDDRNLILY